MLRLAALIWLLVGTVLAGVGVTVVVATPSLALDAFRLIPYAGIGGFVVAIPIGLARLYTGRLVASVVAHSVNNLLPGVALVMMLLGVLPGT